MSATPGVLYDASGDPIPLRSGVAVPAGTSSILGAGIDENAVARFFQQESKASAEVSVPIVDYAARFKPFNDPGAPTQVNSRWDRGGQINACYANGFAKTWGGGYPYGGHSFPVSSIAFSSDNANDNPTGTGARALQFVYYDVNGLKTSVSIALNGTTPVTYNFSPAILIIEEFYVTSFGSLGTIGGNYITGYNAPTADCVGLPLLKFYSISTKTLAIFGYKPALYTGGYLVVDVYDYSANLLSRTALDQCVSTSNLVICDPPIIVTAPPNTFLFVSAPQDILIDYDALRTGNWSGQVYTVEYP